MSSTVVHFEIYVDDIARAKKFYSDVFGWVYEAMGPDMNDYVVVYPGGVPSSGPAKVGINGGMLKRPGPAPSDNMASPNAYVCMVAVDDIDETMAKVEPAGGRIDMPVNEVPTVGKIAYIRDTEMNLVGVMKPTLSGGN